MTDEVLYFAYGSNMSTQRIRARIPARLVGTAKLTKHCLTFEKPARDGSGKCDVAYTGDANHVLWGVVYGISQQDLPILDTYESLGVGYDRKTITVTLNCGTPCATEIYIARDNNPNVLPFCWYKQHVQYGAEENNLPTDYIQNMIASVPVINDPDDKRRAKEIAIYSDL